MTARELLDRWADRDDRYRLHSRAARTEAEVVAVRDWRVGEAMALPAGEPVTYLTHRAMAWEPPKAWDAR